MPVAPWMAVDQAVVVMTTVQAVTTAVGRVAGKLTVVAMEGMVTVEEVGVVVQAVATEVVASVVGSAVVGWEAHKPLAKSAAESLAHFLEQRRHCSHNAS